MVRVILQSFHLVYGKNVAVSRFTGCTILVILSILPSMHCTFSSLECDLIEGKCVEVKP
jgi:hypothetical protein